MKLIYFLLSAFLTVAMLPNSVFAEDDKEWTVSIEPYLMLTTIKGTAGIGRVTGVPVNVQFSDILKDLEFAAMIHAEAHHNSGWGILFDYAYMNLGAHISNPLGGVTNAGVKQGVLELLAARKLAFAGGSFELLGGFRWWTNNVDLTVNPAILPGSARASIDESWIDPVVGGRLTMPVTEQMEFVIRGDLGGFGVGSDFTTLIASGIHYRFTEMISLDVQMAHQGRPAILPTIR